MPSLHSNGLRITTSIVTGLIGGLFAILGVVYLAAATSIHNSEITDHRKVESVASIRGVGGVVLAIAIFLILVCIRAARAGLLAGARDVIVRNVTSTERFTPDQVAGIGVQPLFGRRVWRPVVITTDGRLVGAGWAAKRHPTTAWAEELAAFDRFRPKSPDPIDARAMLAVANRLDPNPPPELATKEWNSPPGWDPPPPGWRPPPGWMPPQHWPMPPADWNWWTSLPLIATVKPLLIGRDKAAPIEEASVRRTLKLETWLVMVSFLLPAIAGAVIGLVEDLVGKKHLDNFSLPVAGHVTVSLLILILSYVPLAAAVPVALLLLARTGQTPSFLRLTRRDFVRDIFPAIGLAIAAFAGSAIVGLIFKPLFNNSSISNTAHQTHVPAYFVIYALILSATTAITEEVFVNGYLLTRLSQMNWRPWPAFIVSLALRTSYHAYYGVAIIATIPFGYLVTRSFQKHGRLSRPILTHFVYDATLLTIAVLTS